MSEAIENLQLDIEELQKCHDASTRKRVKDCLLIEIRRVQTEISLLKEKETNKDNVVKSSPAASQKAKRFLKVLTNYGWDQSDKFMKIYVTLNGVQNIAKENVKCSFSDRSFQLLVEDLDNKDFSLKVGNLFGPICEESSSFKIKTDMVLVMLKKKEIGKTWAYVTLTEKKQKDAEKNTKPDMDPEDPSAGIMNLMKKMYDEGDDEMKRTINKAWAENQDKKMAP